MKFAVMGTGEYGSNYGSRLVQAGLDVTFIARGQRYEEIKRNGLHIQVDSQGRKTDLDTVQVTNISTDTKVAMKRGISPTAKSGPYEAPHSGH